MVIEHNKLYTMTIRLHVSTVTLILYKECCVQWSFLYFLLDIRISWNLSLTYSAMYSLRTDGCKKCTNKSRSAHCYVKRQL